jgi:excisionase family DNA binding protein
VTEKLLLTIPEVADALCLGRSKVYELLSSGAIESVQVGRARRVPRDALDAFVTRLRNENGLKAANGDTHH